MTHYGNGHKVALRDSITTSLEEPTAVGNQPRNRNPKIGIVENESGSSPKRQ